MFLAMLMISVRRGTPSVTFLADTPAKWKVFRVICGQSVGSRGVRGGQQGTAQPRGRHLARTRPRTPCCAVPAQGPTCVVGSPMDCAATVPTTSPGAAMAFMKLRSQAVGRGRQKTHSGGIKSFFESKAVGRSS